MCDPVTNVKDAKEYDPFSPPPNCHRGCELFTRICRTTSSFATGVKNIFDRDEDKRLISNRFWSSIIRSLRGDNTNSDI